MILCSCNRITCRDLEHAVDSLIQDNPSASITIGQVYRSLGKRPKCGSCLANTNKHVRSRATCLRGNALASDGANPAQESCTDWIDPEVGFRQTSFST